MACLEPSLLNNAISTNISHAGLSNIWWPFPLILFILMDYPIHIDTLSMEKSILYFKGSLSRFLKKMHLRH